MDPRPITALLIEDEADEARLLELRLEQCAPPGARFAVRRAGSLAEGLTALDAEDFDIIFLGLQPPAGRGLELLERLRGRPAPPPVVVYAGFRERDFVARGLRGGAAAYLFKDLLNLRDSRRAVALAFLRRLSDDVPRVRPAGDRVPSAI